MCLAAWQLLKKRNPGILPVAPPGIPLHRYNPQVSASLSKCLLKKIYLLCGYITATNAGAYFTPRLQTIHCDVTPILLTTPLDVWWVACYAC